MSSLNFRRNQFQQQAERNVFRLKNSMPDKFDEIMLKHLRSSIDIKLHDTDIQMHRVTPEKVTIKRRSSFKFYKKPIKKREVTELTSDSMSAMIKLMDFVGRSHYITDEGIFRKTGNIVRQREIRKQVMENSPFDFDNITSHDAACVLKNFIRDLPEPLLTNHFMNIYHHLATDLTTADKSKTITLKVLQLMMLMLPGDNYCVLRPLMVLLYRAAKTPENLMSASSLAIIFTPHFLCSKTMSGSELHMTTETFSSLVAFMIENGNNLFRIPQELSEEVSNFWKEMEVPNYLYPQSVTKKNRPLSTLDDSALLESPTSPEKTSTRRSLVHIVDLGVSPDKKRKSGIFSFIQKRSSKTDDGSQPERRILPDAATVTSKDNITSTQGPEKPKKWTFQSVSTKDKPVAMVRPMTRSPISQFFKTAPQHMQNVMQNSRSKAPMPYQSMKMDREEEIMC